MKIQLSTGETSVILIVFIQNSSVATGAGLGSLDQTSGIVGGYVKRGGVGAALAVNEDVTTEGTFEPPTSAGQVRIGTPANMPTGFYELHFDNDLFTGADYIVIGLGGATNMAPLNIEIPLGMTDNLITNDAFAALAISASKCATTFFDNISDVTRNENLSAHQAAQSAGLYLTQVLQSNVLISGTVSTNNSSNEVDLGGGSAIDDFYNGCLVIILTGTGAGQVRLIYDYGGSSNIAVISPNWVTVPVSSDTFLVLRPGFSSLQQLLNGSSPVQVQGQNLLKSDLSQIGGNSSAATNLGLIAVNSKGSDHKVLVSSDAQDLSASLKVNTKVLETGLDLTSTMKSSVKSEADQAMTDYNGPTHSEMTTEHGGLSTEHVGLDTGHTALGVQNTDISGRIPASLQSGRMKSNIDAIGDSNTVDGVTLTIWAELIQAMVNGRFKKDTPSVGQITFYKRDNSTVLTIVSTSDTERTRIS